MSRLYPEGFIPVTQLLQKHSDQELLGREVIVFGKYPRSQEESLQILFTGTIHSIDRKGDDQDPYNFGLYANTVISVISDKGVVKDYTVRIVLVKE